MVDWRLQANRKNRLFRSRNSFNVERMVMHTAKEVKDWGDPADISLASRYPIDIHGSASPREILPMDVEEQGKFVWTQLMLEKSSQA